MDFNQPESTSGQLNQLLFQSMQTRLRISHLQNDTMALFLMELEEKMKKRIYRLFLALMVSLSLGSSPLAQNEIRKMLESLSGAAQVQVQEVQEPDEEEKII